MAENEYVIFISEAVMLDPAWEAVALRLARQHAKNGLPAPHCVVEVPSLQNVHKTATLLGMMGARYAAFVLKPEEIGREVITALHRATRMVDADPWGDCLWGIVTGASAQDALQLVSDAEPLTIKRLLATTHVQAAPFEQSYCITDWEKAPVVHQRGCREPEMQHLAEGEGREGLFAEQLATQKPQLIVTSSHATPFNLEMPFGKGLIFPAAGRFHCLSAAQMAAFGKPLAAAMQGDHSGLEALAAGGTPRPIEPDGEARVWIAAGNCLLGNAHHTAGSMAVTALSAYSCRQLVGYTVPSWYGKGGWGTLSLFMDNAQDTSLAEAWYLNNQFLLAETQKLSPELLQAEFHEAEINPAFIRQLTPLLHRLGFSAEQSREALGLVHDRDVVAFYGDPARRASVDNGHHPRPLRVQWEGLQRFTLTANRDHKGRAAVWFPTAAHAGSATGCNAPGAVFTNDFILFPELEMKAGEVLTVTLE